MLAVFALPGCAQDQKVAQDRPLDLLLVRLVQDTALKNAVIAQRTLFPYHFVPDSDELNDLGMVDLSILATHFWEFPGELSVRRGDAPRELYEARVRRVKEKLEEAGVPTGSVAIADRLPAGPGMPSERVVKILQREEEASRSQGESRSAGGATTRSGTSSSGSRSGRTR